MKSKKLITSLLTLSMLASTIVPAYAAETNEVVDPLPGTGYSKITVEVKDTSGGGGTDPDNPDNPDNPDIPPVDPTDIIIATVPVELPIIMDLEGNVTVPTDAKIINHVEDKGIKVTDISVTLDSSWSAANFSDDFTSKTDDSKELGLSFRGDTLSADGTFTITEGNWNIAKNSNLPLNMAAKLPKQTTASKTQAATVGFTIDWSGLDGTDGGSDPDAGKDNSGGSGEVNPPEESTVTVSFTTDGNGTLEGDTSTTVKAGEPAPFPTAKPSSIRYEHTGWVDTTTNNKIEPTTPITSDTTIKAVFSERAASPKNWFTSSNGTITGLSDEYLNLIDAPTDLVIPNNIGGSTIKSIGANAFANKDLITSIVIPDTITSIAADAFSGCDSLTEINLDYAYTYSILNSPFGLTDEKVHWAPLEDWDTNPMRTSDFETKNMKISVNNDGVITDITRVDGYLMNIGLGTFTFPTSLDGKQITGLNGINTFYILISKAIIPGYKFIGSGAFFQSGSEYSCLTEVEIQEGCESIGDNAFNYCTNLSKAELPSTVKTIGKWAFGNCGGLSDINIPNSVTTIGETAFYNVPHITYNGTATGAPWRAKSINDSCTYSDDNKLILSLDGKAVLAPNGNITSVAIPDGVTSINNNAFYECKSLKSISIPNSVTSIGGGAFYNCSNLGDVAVPSSVTTIGASAFYKVKHIRYNGTATGAPWAALKMN